MPGGTIPQMVDLLSMEELRWLVGLVVIWFPELIVLIGEFMGVTRSIDALVYIAVVYLLYVSLRQKIKLNEVHKEITLLSRKTALEGLRSDERKI